MREKMAGEIADLKAEVTSLVNQVEKLEEAE